MPWPHDGQRETLRRMTSYDAIADVGYTVTSEEVDRVQNSQDFVELLEMAIERDTRE